MSDPQPVPIFAINAWADGEVTKAEPTTEENEQ